MRKDKVELLSNPYGEVAYETFGKLGRAIVDKTLVIKDLEDKKTPLYPVLLRPRRFGKSTFVQMLKCFYDLSYKDRYDEIFSTKKIPTEAEKKTPSGFIRAFFKAYKQYPAKKSLYIMIDEYDNFANSVLSEDLELFKVITSSGGFLKDFYSAIKE